jgi:hypothetical protein
MKKCLLPEEHWHHGFEYGTSRGIDISLLIFRVCVVKISLCLFSVFVLSRCLSAFIPCLCCRDVSLLLFRVCVVEMSLLLFCLCVVLSDLAMG